jgi:hypothetical protein
MWYTKMRSYWDRVNDPREDALVVTKPCDISTCPHRGDFRAPKSREVLNDYYWFCLEHVREYNQNWDFFKGMSQADVEKQIYKNMVGDRPTWRSTEAGRPTEAGLREDKIRKFIYDTYKGNTAEENAKENVKVKIHSIPHPAVEALAVMNLTPPVEWEAVKIRYKMLAKKYHPDINGMDKISEEQLKKINLAYSILKLSYQNYTQLTE